LLTADPTAPPDQTLNSISTRRRRRE